MRPFEHLIGKAIARSEKKWRASKAYYPDRRFPDYDVGAVAAKKILHAAFGSHARLPRPGYTTDLPSEDHGYWQLSNKASKYKLQFIHR